MLEQRIYNYAERFFQASGGERFPTVRQVARAMKVRQATVYDAVEGWGERGLMLTSEWNESAIGDHYVETY